MKKKYTYEEAKNRLEEIVESLEQPSLDIEGLSARIEEAQELLAFCRERLQKVETDVKKALENGEG